MIPFRRIQAAWDRFWFTPASPTPIALYRIFVGLLSLAAGLTYLPDLTLWIGPNSTLSASAVKDIFQSSHLNLFRLLPNGQSWATGFFILFLLACITLAAGLFTRASAIAVWLGLTSLAHQNPVIANFGDTFLRISAFFLIFSEAGAALSFDRFLQNKSSGKKDPAPPSSFPWAQRFIQIQLSLVYLTDCFWKTQGVPWADGTAVYYISRNETYMHFPVPYLFAFFPATQCMTWGVILFELLLGLGLWVLEFRYFLIAAGIIFHLFLDYAFNLPVAQWAMIAAYATFIEPERLEKTLAAVFRRKHAR